MRIRGRLVGGLAAAAIAIGAVACASSGDLEATQQDLAQAKSDLVAVTTQLSDLEGRLTTAQADLAAVTEAEAALKEAEAGLQASVTSLADGQTAVKTSVASVGAELSDTDERLTELTGTLGTDLDALERDLTKAASDVRTNKTGIADGVRGLAAPREDLDAVTAQSGDLKASFLLTRDDVTANAETIDAQQTRSLEVERVALVTHLFRLWGQTSFGTATKGSIRERVRLATVATGDPALEALWLVVPSALDVFVNDQNDSTAQAFIDARESFVALLSRSLSDTLAASAE